MRCQLLIAVLVLTGCSGRWLADGTCPPQAAPKVIEKVVVQPVALPAIPPPPPVKKLFYEDNCDKKYVACFTESQFAALNEAFLEQKNYSLTIYKRYNNHRRH